MDIRYVKQKHKNGCVVASLAMVTGHSYADVAAFFGPRFMRCGLTDGDASEYLLRCGYSVTWRPNCVDRSTDPWLDRHIVCLRLQSSTARGHCVVLLGDGTVLDPMTTERTALTHPDYAIIRSVIGIHPSTSGYDTPVPNFPLPRISYR